MRLSTFWVFSIGNSRWVAPRSAASAPYAAGEAPDRLPHPPCYHQTLVRGFLMTRGRRKEIAFSAPSSGDITGSSCSNEST